MGLIGRQRAEALSRIDGATLAATVDPAGSNGTYAAGAVHYATVEQLPRESYDAAIIAVPHDVAGPLATGVLEAGRPILVEKPLAADAATARKLETLAGTLAAPSFVGYNYRYLPAIRELLSCVASGQLGTLRNIDMYVGHGGHPGSAASWKLDPERAGGGVLLDPGVHLLDLLLRLLPASECTAIEASCGFWPTGIEEDLVAVFREMNTIATVRVSHIRWINTFRVEVLGDRGYAIATGRGGNYGPMTLRIGRRWAWADMGAPSQRDSEIVYSYGSDNHSLRDELADVILRWRLGHTSVACLGPATMSEGRSVTELCEQLYARISLPPRQPVPDRL